MIPDKTPGWRLARNPSAVARAEGQAEEMRRRLETEMEALRRPYHDDPWPWIMIVITVVMGSIIVAAIRLPETSMRAVLPRRRLTT